MKRILLVEDDGGLRTGLVYALMKQGYEAAGVRTCQEAERTWREESYDLVILDVNLPDGSGYELCAQLRRSSEVPILFLTAADEETDIIMGLDIGGDDYITKPFQLAVFLARVGALLRRSGRFSQEGTYLCANGITLERLTREVKKDGAPVALTAGEYRLLCLFMEHPGIVLSPEQILGRLWDCDANYIDTNTLTVYIRRLRAKIEDDPSDPHRIVTVRRMGYKWNAAG
ncbi:MAG: response regulator transcription factor [Eubacteriales bacterium]|nr:response regulator transcription factor [Eubacteriales bacterium]